MIVESLTHLLHEYLQQVGLRQKQVGLSIRFEHTEQSASRSMASSLIEKNSPSGFPGSLASVFGSFVMARYRNW